MSALLVLCAVLACSGRPTESGAENKQLAATGSPEAFAGTWRSVTPQAEFIGLIVTPLSREQGVFYARLMFSGVYWEGSGRIEGDSLVTEMAMAGAATPTGRLVARSRDGGLVVSLRSPSPTINLTFVREN